MVISWPRNEGPRLLGIYVKSRRMSQQKKLIKFYQAYKDKDGLFDPIYSDKNFSKLC